MLLAYAVRIVILIYQRLSPRNLSLLAWFSYLVYRYSHDRSQPMAERFVVRSTVLFLLPSLFLAMSRIPAKRFYCATCFHSSTRCSQTCLHPWNLRFSSLAYLFSVFPSPPLPPSLSFCVRHFLSTPDFYRAGINPSCRLRLILQLSLIQRIPCGTLLLLPSIWREIDLPLGLLHRDTWWTVNAEHTAGIIFKSNLRNCINKFKKLYK